MNTYDIGSLVRTTASFKIGNVLTDPGVMTFRLKAPDGTTTSHIYGSGVEVVKDSTGVYHVDWPVTAPGTYHYRAEGTGIAQAAEEGLFYVAVSSFS